MRGNGRASIYENSKPKDLSENNSLTLTIVGDFKEGYLIKKILLNLDSTRIITSLNLVSGLLT